MAKRTKKVGLTGKYGTRYGRSLRKQMKKIETLQHTRYVCPFCQKESVKRTAAGIWECRACGKQQCGGAYSLQTSTAVTARAAIRRLREMKTM
ncbi:ribosomal protein L37ae [Kipferlia bialata]|uniref:Ribosomal protein L37ae n=1 Tax=Kipferlia bialata TaxID=797122 RepID=A0A9K3D5N6_9EUKA|nr:ribosomal protein L37ae [Kipferlia bialata]|eukprot:g12069.t1